MRYDTAKYLFEWIGTATFAYLLLDGLLVLWFNGYTARISLEGFLIPHASKVVLWSAAALFWLRPKFQWKFPLILLLLYCVAELTTNWIYVPVHLLTDPSYIGSWMTVWGNKNYYFILSNAFFILGIVLARTFTKGSYTLRFDWAMLPFVAFVSLWVLTGYQTDSTVFYAVPGIELEEFLWSVLYLSMMFYSFRPKEETLPFWERPAVG